LHVEQLESFLEVARRGNISRTAEATFVNQPTLTARLHALEREVGAALFVRSRRGMRLTDAGRAFLPFAERALRELRAGKAAVDGSAAPTSGRLVLAAAPAVSTYQLPDLLQRFAAAYPRVEIAVRTGHSEDVLAMVLREDIDLGFMRAIAHKDIQAWPFSEEQLVLVVAPRHPFSKHRAVKTAALGDEKLILFDRTSSYYELTQALFINAGVQPRSIMELDNIEAAKRMVERRLGVALLPRSAVERDIGARKLRLVRIADAPQVTQSIVIARRRDFGPPQGIVAAFLALARKERQSR